MRFGNIGKYEAFSAEKSGKWYAAVALPLEGPKETRIGDINQYMPILKCYGWIIKAAVFTNMTMKQNWWSNI